MFTNAKRILMSMRKRLLLFMASRNFPPLAEELGSCKNMVRTWNDMFTTTIDQNDTKQNLVAANQLCNWIFTAPLDKNCDWTFQHSSFFCLLICVVNEVETDNIAHDFLFLHKDFEAVFFQCESFPFLLAKIHLCQIIVARNITWKWQEAQETIADHMHFVWPQAKTTIWLNDDPQARNTCFQQLFLVQETPESFKMIAHIAATKEKFLKKQLANIGFLTVTRRATATLIGSLEIHCCLHQRCLHQKIKWSTWAKTPQGKNNMKQLFHWAHCQSWCTTKLQFAVRRQQKSGDSQNEQQTECSVSNAGSGTLDDEHASQI